MTLLRYLFHYENNGKVQEENSKNRLLEEKTLTSRCCGGAYKYIRNVEDYTNCKETLNLATTEIR